MHQYMESKDIVFGNKRLSIKESLKKNLNIDIIENPDEFRTIFNEGEIIDSEND